MKRIVCRGSCILQARSQQINLLGSRLVQTRLHSHDHDHDKEGEVAEIVNINWQNRDGTVTSTKAKAGSNLLSLARKYDIELEGACEGVCACSTCHIILEDAVFDAQPDPSEDEEDMLGERLDNCYYSHFNSCSYIPQQLIERSCIVTTQYLFNLPKLQLYSNFSLPFLLTKRGT
jgi:ferredoxin